MIRLIALVAVAAAIVILAGCASVVPVDCRLPEPPASLLTIPEPLPPVPADLPESPRRP